VAANHLRRIRFSLAFFIFGLAVSGVTAFPLERELKMLARFTAAYPDSGLNHWFVIVRDALIATNAQYPFLAYGTDWLAFAHIVLAVAFIGPFLDPVKNIWVIEFGLIACVLVIPLALIAGGVRGIPLGWRFIDCSFGIIGILPLLYCRSQIRKIEPLETFPKLEK
jgi:hypothetical protein